MTLRAFDFLRAWRAQRGHTIPVPGPVPPFPGRFRGRPVPAAPAAAPSPAPTRGRTLPVLDLGACLAAPDQPQWMPGTVEWTHDIRVSARTRAGLLLPADGSAPAVEPLDEPLRALLGRSLRLRSVVAGSCSGCEAELVALGNVVFDLARFGVQFVASPRHADGIVITGVVNANMLDALRRAWAAVPDPRIVIAVGACAASGGPFAGSPGVLGIPSDVPVDLWVAGCPPHPLSILDGILQLLGHPGPGPRASPRATLPAAAVGRGA